MSTERASREPKVVDIHADGACSGNPGPGGYGVILVHNGQRRELSRGFRRTTNNRMELLAAIAGLEALKQRCRVRLYSDSKYVVRGMDEGWARKWRANGWRRERNKLAANWDLWRDLLAAAEKHDVSFHWVRGHSGDPYNERCDQLAVAAAAGSDLDVDRGYEEPAVPPG